MYVEECRFLLSIDCSGKMAVIGDNIIVSTLVAFSLACHISYCHGQGYPFRNTSLSFEERVKVYSGLMAMYVVE